MIKKLTVFASLLFAFTAVNAQSMQVTLLSPANGQPLVPVNTAFAWDTLDVSVDSVTLQVSTTNTFDAVVFWKSFPDTIYAHTLSTALQFNSTYYWRVMSYDSLGLKVDSSNAFSFVTVGPPPPAPNNVSPTTASIDQGLYPNLTWTSVPVATNYRVHISTRDNFSDTAFHAIVVGGNTNVNVNIRLTSYTVYYWRVAAENSGGLSAWSNFWNFTTLVSSVKDAEGNFTLSAYPNPSSDKVFVSFETAVEGQGRVSLLDLNGKEVQVLANDKLEAGKHEYAIERKDLSAGVYFVKVLHEGAAQTLRVVLQ